MILGLTLLMLQLIQHHLRSTVTHLTAGNVAVFNVDDGAIGMAGGYIVDDHLAVVTKLSGNTGGKLFQQFKTLCLHRHYSLFFFRRSFFTSI